MMDVRIIDHPEGRDEFQHMAFSPGVGNGRSCGWFRAGPELIAFKKH
ncbi:MULTISPECIES: hypothetical protein [unclassified Shinella]|nr:hypothetical protein [Shinella sp. YE25]